MAHNIATDIKTGKAMCYTAGALPWHSLGQNVAEAQTWEEAIKLAGLDWEVLDAPLYTQWTSSGPLKVEGYKAIVRKDTQQTLGVHGEGYKIFQNRDAFRFADALLNEGARYESAGGLGNGERIWCLARIPQADFEIGNGDLHQMFLLVATSHDGSLSTTITCTDVRVVCNNTLTSALGSGNTAADGKLKIKHTRQAEQRLNQAQSMIQGTIITASGLKEKLNALAHAKLTRDSMTTIFDRLFPKPKGETVSQTRRDNMLAEILASYEVNEGNAFPEQRGTAYNLLNAITDYTDHVRGTRRADDTQSVESSRGESALFGTGAKLKSDALNVIYQTVGAGTGFEGQGHSILDTILNSDHNN